jgi:PPM family protein phosphatase
VCWALVADAVIVMGRTICRTVCRSGKTKPPGRAVIFDGMVTAAPGYRLSSATGMHRGDRPYQQDQVEFIAHKHVPGCALAVLADGMGGKSGGRKAADQVIMVSNQLYERFAPTTEDAGELLKQLVLESHQMIRLTAMTAEEEPHSTIAAYVVGPERDCFVVHAGDSRVFHFRGAEMLSRTFDHSLVQRMVDEGRIREEEANAHPQSNLLTGCLGTNQDPPLAVKALGQLDVGDTLLACSDGLWHYFTPREIGVIVHSLSPRDASEMLVAKARQRAKGGGDNISLVITRVESLEKKSTVTAPMPLGRR